MDDDDDEFIVTLDAEGRVDGSAGACETTFCAWDGLLRVRNGSDELDQLRADALWTAWPLARGSFWVAADAVPRNPLEELALKIFRFHTAKSTVPIDLSTSGAEFWSNVTRGENVGAPRGYGNVNVHVDKDERAYGAYGLVVNPLLSTVTYLTDAGAPTVVLPHLRVDPQGDAYRSSAAGDDLEAILVPPRVGRHARFDGRLLHGAPAALCPAALQAAAAAADADADAAAAAAVAGTGERVTFLVNIWVGHRPGNCERFERPATGTPLASVAAPRLRHPSAREAAHAALAPSRLGCGAREEWAEHEKVVGAAKSRSESAAHRLRFAVQQTPEDHELLLPAVHLHPPRLTPGGLSAARGGRKRGARPEGPAGGHEAAAAELPEKRARGLAARLARGMVVSLKGGGIELRRAAAQEV